MLSREPDPSYFAVRASNAALVRPAGLRGRGLTDQGLHLRAVFRQSVLEEHFEGPFREQFRVAEDAVMFQRPIGSLIDQIRSPTRRCGRFPSVKRRRSSLFFNASLLNSRL